MCCVSHFFGRWAHAYLKNKMKKYQLSLKRIKNLALSSNVALPWLQRHEYSEQKMLINMGKKTNLSAILLFTSG